MRYLLRALCGLLAASAAAAQSAELTPESRALIAPVFAAYKDIDIKLAALPAPTSDAERLIRLGQIDEAGRGTYAKIDFSGLTDAQRQAAFDAVYAKIDERDSESIAALKAMIPPEGWFARSKYGVAAVDAAWLVVQHAVRTHPELMPKVLKAMEPMVSTGEVDTHRYAMLYDRVASMEGRYQKYGSQLVCHNRRWVLYPLADQDAVDQRRKLMGFENTVSEHLASFASRQCPSEWNGKLPPGASF